MDQRSGSRSGASRPHSRLPEQPTGSCRGRRDLRLRSGRSTLLSLAVLLAAPRPAFLASSRLQSRPRASPTSLATCWTRPPGQRSPPVSDPAWGQRARSTAAALLEAPAAAAPRQPAAPSAARSSALSPPATREFMTRPCAPFARLQATPPPGFRPEACPCARVRRGTSALRQASHQ